MSDVVDDAEITREHNLAASIAAATSYVRPKGLVPKGACWECDIELDNPKQLFCAAEPGERESSCVRDFNKRGHVR